MTTGKFIVFTCLLAVANARSFVNFESFVSTLSSRILGGHDAKPGDFPHQVSLQLIQPSGNIPYTHFCGGSILNEKWILTAAHCLEVLEQVPKDVVFAVKAGKHDLSTTEDTEQLSFFDLAFIHERYIKNSPTGISPYDVGLIKLKRPLKFNKYVVPISLPKQNSEPAGKSKVILSGWGAVDANTEHPKMPYILQTVDLEIIDRKSCNAAIAKVFKDIGVELPTGLDLADETNVCSGPTAGGISACGGDSGGPLISKDSNGKTEVVGVVSWGFIPCGRRGAPSVYARTAYVVDWIQDIIKRH